ncbi:MAG: hypothetical protein ACR2MW_08555 [Chthoniobacterales bacterium]
MEPKRQWWARRRNKVLAFIGTWLLALLVVALTCNVLGCRQMLAMH